MKRNRLMGHALFLCLFCASTAAAQVTEVVVGITPTCPYGMSACWGGAHEGLSHLEGVDSVAQTPDVYNCTAHVYMKDGEFPRIKQWPDQFKSVVGEIHLFRGVEVTIKGSVSRKDGKLVLQTPVLHPPLMLSQLEHKLQWNFKRACARQPEPDELGAYQRLRAKEKEAGTSDLRAEVTGPLRSTEEGIVLEVREFFLSTVETSARVRD